MQSCLVGWITAAVILTSAMTSAMTSTSAMSSVIFEASVTQGAVFAGSSLLFDLPAASTLHCAILCMTSQNCTAFTFTPHLGQCRGHVSLEATSVASAKAPGTVAYAIAAAGPVSSSSPTVKYQCSTPIMHCADNATLISAGCASASLAPLSGLYRVNISGSVSDVYCDQSVDGGGWMVVMRRQDGTVDFDRNWTEYRAGFGSPAGEYWLGLENLHRLTSSAGYNIRVTIRRKGDNSVCSFTCENALVKAETQLYALSYWSTLDLVGCDDYLRYHANTNFSTYDHDNDGDNTTNRAAYHRGGFWYRKDSGYCNPTGLLSAASPPQSTYWGTPTNPYVYWADSLTFIEFKIKRR